MRCAYRVNNIADLIILLQRILLQDIGKLLYIVWKTLLLFDDSLI